MSKSSRDTHGRLKHAMMASNRSHRSFSLDTKLSETKSVESKSLEAKMVGNASAEEYRREAIESYYRELHAKFPQVVAKKTEIKELLQKNEALTIGDIEELTKKLDRYDVMNFELIKTEVDKATEETGMAIDRLINYFGIKDEKLIEQIETTIKLSTLSGGDLSYLYIKWQEEYQEHKRTPKPGDLLKKLADLSFKKGGGYIKNQREQMISSLVAEEDKSAEDKNSVKSVLINLSMPRLYVLSKQKDFKSKIENRIENRRELQRRLVAVYAKQHRFDVNDFLLEHFNVGGSLVKHKIGAEKKYQLKDVVYAKLRETTGELDSIQELRDKINLFIKNPKFSYMSHRFINDPARNVQKFIKDTGFENSNDCYNYISRLLNIDHKYKNQCEEYYKKEAFYQANGVAAPRYLNGESHVRGNGFLLPEQRKAFEIIRANLATIDKQLRQQESGEILLNVNDPLFQKIQVRQEDKFAFARQSDLEASKDVTSSTLAASEKSADVMAGLDEEFKKDVQAANDDVQKMRQVISQNVGNALKAVANIALTPIGGAVAGVAINVAGNLADKAGEALGVKVFRDPFVVQPGEVTSVVASQIARAFYLVLQNIRYNYTQEFTEQRLHEVSMEAMSEILRKNPNKKYTRDELQQAIQERVNEKYRELAKNYDKSVNEFKEQVKQFDQSQNIIQEVVAVSSRMINKRDFAGRLIKPITSIDDYCEQFSAMWKLAEGRWGGENLVSIMESSSWLGGDANEAFRKSLGFVHNAKIELNNIPTLLQSAKDVARLQIGKVKHAMRLKKENMVQHQRLLTAFAADIIVSSFDKYCGTAVIMSVATPEQKAKALLDVFEAMGRIPQFGGTAKLSDNMIMRVLKSIPDARKMLADKNVVNHLLKERFSKENVERFAEFPEEARDIDAVIMTYVKSVILDPIIQQSAQALETLSKLKQQGHAPKEQAREQALLEQMNAIVDLQRIPRDWQERYPDDYRAALGSCMDVVKMHLDEVGLKNLKTRLIEQINQRIVNASDKANAVVESLQLIQLFQQFQKIKNSDIKPEFLLQSSEVVNLDKILQNQEVLDALPQQTGYEQLSSKEQKETVEDTTRAELLSGKRKSTSSLQVRKSSAMEQKDIVAKHPPATIEEKAAWRKQHQEQVAQQQAELAAKLNPQVDVKQRIATYLNENTLIMEVNKAYDAQVNSRHEAILLALKHKRLTGDVAKSAYAEAEQEYQREQQVANREKESVLQRGRIFINKLRIAANVVDKYLAQGLNATDADKLIIVKLYNRFNNEIVNKIIKDPSILSSPIRMRGLIAHLNIIFNDAKEERFAERKKMGMVKHLAHSLKGAKSFFSGSNKITFQDVSDVMKELATASQKDLALEEKVVAKVHAKVAKLTR